MTNLTETISRLRRDNYGDDGALAKINDALAFATACLDTTPIDDDYVKSLGVFSVCPLQGFLEVNVDDLATLKYGLHTGNVFLARELLSRITTRGQLISLLFALGVL